MCLAPKNIGIVLDYFGIVTNEISCPLISLFHYIVLTTPSTVVLLVCIGVGGCLCPISSSACCADMDYLQFLYRAPSSASAAEDITALIICAVVRIAPLFGGSGESLGMKNWPCALLQAFVSEFLG